VLSSSSPNDFRRETAHWWQGHERGFSNPRTPALEWVHARSLFRCPFWSDQRPS